MSIRSVDCPDAGKRLGRLRELRATHVNLSEPGLVECAVRRGEGMLSADGALVVDTGTHTGRSPRDKFVVRDPASEGGVWWDNNAAMSPEAFELLLSDMVAHAAGLQTFRQDLQGGADPASRINVRVFTELAWHNLFIRNLLIKPNGAGPDDAHPDLTIVDLPSFAANPARYGVRSQTVIACDLADGVVLIAGTSYAGEMKKAVFTYLNYRLPAQGIMPMHCSANVGADGRTAVFFGLSGTGKTTLSASSDRTLVGDDEHGWGPDGIFNVEGGCYAKTIKLDPVAEPHIHAAALRFGTVLENVILDPATRQLDFHDGRKTENTRAAYPLAYIANTAPSGMAPHPSDVVMLTADAFGVMPPIARLTPNQALYFFLSGFTAKVAGTERGVVEPQPTFSTCFGAPFLPRRPGEYASLLRVLIDKHDVRCWLVNTGWTGGPFGVGRRMPIQWTRTLLNAALEGRLSESTFRTDRNFGFMVPTAVEGVPAQALDPAVAWAERDAYDAQARRLVDMFVDNFARFADMAAPYVQSPFPAR